MKAVKYKLNAYADSLSFAHGMKMTVQEIRVELQDGYGLFFNNKGGIFVDKTSLEEREAFEEEEIEISDDDFQALKKFVEVKTRLYSDLFNKHARGDK